LGSFGARRTPTEGHSGLIETLEGNPQPEFKLPSLLFTTPRKGLLRPASKQHKIQLQSHPLVSKMLNNDMMNIGGGNAGLGMRMNIGTDGIAIAAAPDFEDTSAELMGHVHPPLSINPVATIHPPVRAEHASAGASSGDYGPILFGGCNRQVCNTCNMQHHINVQFVGYMTICRQVNMCCVIAIAVPIPIAESGRAPRLTRTEQVHLSDVPPSHFPTTYPHISTHIHTYPEHSSRPLESAHVTYSSQSLVISLDR